MRKQRLTDDQISKRFTQLLGEPSVSVTSLQWRSGLDALKFELGEQSLTIAVPTVEFHHSLTSFSRRYIGKVAAMFQQTQPEPDPYSGHAVQTLPASSPGAATGALHA